MLVKINEIALNEIMKTLFFTALLFPLFLKAYYAEVRGLDKPAGPVIYSLDLSEVKKGEITNVTAQFTTGAKVEMEEKAILNETTAEFIQYVITQYQTKEKGFIEVVGDTVKMKYEIEGKPTQTKEIKKPKDLVAPPNFDRWLKKNLTELKKEKTMTIDFLVWDRLDTYKFKVSYLGQTEKEGRKIQQFKMNINNFMLAAFITPIEIDMNDDLSQLVSFRGRVAVKIKKGDKYENLDADVKYFYK